MTVIWFNDDDDEHTVTTVQNNSGSAPEILDSGPIQGMGGSFIHTFTKEGIYNYYDQMNPTVQGHIIVGGPTEEGRNMNMIVGGKLPYNPKEPQSIMLNFVPNRSSFHLQLLQLTLS